MHCQIPQVLQDQSGFVSERRAAACFLPMRQAFYPREIAAPGLDPHPLAAKTSKQELIAIRTRRALNYPLVAKFRAAKVRAAKVRAAKVRAAKVRAAKVRAAKARAAKFRAAKVRAAKFRVAKVRAAKVRAAKVRAAKVRAVKIPFSFFVGCKQFMCRHWSNPPIEYI
jgi:hypothetical protein